MTYSTDAEVDLKYVRYRAINAFNTGIVNSKLTDA